MHYYYINVFINNAYKCYWAAVPSDEGSCQAGTITIHGSEEEKDFTVYREIEQSQQGKNCPEDKLNHVPYECACGDTAAANCYSRKMGIALNNPHGRLDV